MNEASTTTSIEPAGPAPAKKRPTPKGGKAKRPSRPRKAGKQASGKGKKSTDKSTNGKGKAPGGLRRDFNGLRLLPGSYAQKLFSRLMANKGHFITQAAAVSATYGNADATYNHCRLVLGSIRNQIKAAKLPLEIRTEEKQVGIFTKGK